MSVDQAGNLNVTRAYKDGQTESFKNEEALANLEGTEAERKYRAENPVQAFAARSTGPDDQRKSTMFQYGVKGRRMLDDAGRSPRTWAGRILDSGRIPSTLFGAAVGGGLGAGADYVARNLLGLNTHFGLLGAAGGGLGGLAIGHMRQGIDWANMDPAQIERLYPGSTQYVMNKPASADMRKEAAMYHDPRNFILEKLQASNDISSSVKAQIAYQVRNLSKPQADAIASKVRSAMSIGVGALIAKLLGVNPMLGAMSGFIGAAAVRMLTTPRGYVQQSPSRVR